VFLFSLVLGALVTGITGIPRAETHDEFSYLLAADTFAHGRLANEPHPLWEHFESFHILQQPTYQSKYQPGQGLVLALGQVLSGEPIVGAWLATALACAATCWALRGVLTARWAMFAGVMVALHPVGLLWSQNYWGGSLAMSGGALVFGSAIRLGRRACPLMGAAWGIGVLVLFNTRPFEGAMFAAIVTTPLLLRTSWMRPGVIGAGVAVIALGAGAAAYYDYRVTGSPWRLPYSVHEEQYGSAPLLIWQDFPPANALRHAAMAEFKDVAEVAPARRQRSVKGFATESGRKLWTQVKAFGAQPILIVPILGLPFALRRRGVGMAGVGALIFIAVLLLPTWSFAHYAAPGVVLGAYLVTLSLRQMVLGRSGLLWLFTAVYLGTSAWWVVGRAESLPESWGGTRQALIDELLAEPGDDLVIVRYGPGRNVNTEWVYNPADIDGAPVVFARDMGEGNARLLRHFAGRRVWRLNVDGQGATIKAHE
jgi:hypothetical protein